MALGKRSIEDEVCDKYEQCRRRIHPGYSAGNRHDEHWRQAAILIRSIGADPRLFVEAQFEIGCVNSQRAVPFPAQIHGGKAVDNYERYRSAFQSKAEETLGAQFTYLANFVNRCGMTIDQAISDPTNPFRPYFRILVCSETVLDAVEAKWGEAARKELRMNTDLRDYITDKHGYRAQRIIRQSLPGEAGGEHRPPPPPSEFAREREDLTRRF